MKKLALILIPIIVASVCVFISKQEHKASCAAVMIVGARGSETHPGPGFYAEAIAEELAKNNVDYRLEALDFPASQDSVQDYSNSVRLGSEKMHEWVVETREKCPAAKTVLIGHSQGGHVVNTYINNYENENVAIAVMAANPIRSNSLSLVEYLSFPGETLRSGDFLETVPEAEALEPKASWKGKVFDICHSDDLVCNRDNSKLATRAFNPHIKGYLSPENLKVPVDLILKALHSP